MIRNFNASSQENADARHKLNEINWNRHSLVVPAEEEFENTTAIGAVRLARLIIMMEVDPNFDPNSQYDPDQLPAVIPRYVPRPKFGLLSPTHKKVQSLLETANLPDASYFVLDGNWHTRYKVPDIIIPEDAHLMGQDHQVLGSATVRGRHHIPGWRGYGPETEPYQIVFTGPYEPPVRPSVSDFGTRRDY